MDQARAHVRPCRGSCAADERGRKARARRAGSRARRLSKARTSLALVFGLRLVATGIRLLTAGPRSGHASGEDGERGERSKTAPADRLSDLRRHGQEFRVKPAAAASRELETGSLHVATAGQETSHQPN